MTAQQAEAPQAVPAPECGARHPSESARCTRDPRHKGGHIDKARNMYWQAEEPQS